MISRVTPAQSVIVRDPRPGRMPDPWGSSTAALNSKPEPDAGRLTDIWLLPKPQWPGFDGQKSTPASQPSLPWGYLPGQSGLQSLSDDSSQKSLSPVGTVANLSELAGDLEKQDAHLASSAGAAGADTDDPEAGDTEAGRRRTKFLSEKNRKVFAAKALLLHDLLDL